MNIAAHQLERFATVGQDKVIGNAFVVLEEIAFDCVGLMTKTKDEIFVTIMRIVLHYVPQDGSVADWDHGLWHDLGVFAHAHPESATKQYNFHTQSPVVETQSILRDLEMLSENAMTGRFTF